MYRLLIVISMLFFIHKSSICQLSTNSWYKIQARHSGKCLNVQNASSKEGAPIIQWSCTNDCKLPLFSDHWDLEFFVF